MSNRVLGSRIKILVLGEGGGGGAGEQLSTTYTMLNRFTFILSHLY